MSKSEIKGGFIDTQKRLNDRKSLMEFVTQIQQNPDKAAYSVFYQEAEKKGFIEKSPQRKFQYHYYDTYIKPQLDINQFETPKKAQSVRGRNQSTGGGNFIPLRDLLKRNHDDRVQDYLTKMNEESQEDVMNTATGIKASGDQTSKQKQIFNEVKKLQTGEGLHSTRNQKSINFDLPIKDQLQASFSKNEKKLATIQTDSKRDTKFPKIIAGKYNPLQTQPTLTQKSSIQTSPSKIKDKIGERSRGGVDKPKLVQNLAAVNIPISKEINDPEKTEEHYEHTSEGGGSITNNTDRNTQKARGKGKSIKKNNTFVLDRKNNTAWKDYFNNQIAPDKRLTRQRLKEFLSKRYKDQISNRICSIMGPYLSNYTANTISMDDFAQGLELMFNRDENALRKLAFELFDMNKDKKLSENDMFDLMKAASGYGPKQERNLDQPRLLSLDQKMSDLFLDVFAQDYIKIIKAIERKKEARGISHDDFMAQKLENLTHGLTLNPKGIGNVEQKFGKNKEKKNLRDSSTMSKEEVSIDKQNTMKIDENTGAKKQEKEKNKQATSAMVAEAALTKIKKQEDKTFFITEVEFVNIPFDNDWPLIIKDLAHYFTNQDLLKSQRIDEKVEHPTQLTLGIEPKESDFQIYRQALMPQNNPAQQGWWYALNSFRTFEGKEQKIKCQKDVDHIIQASALSAVSETSLFVTEQQMVKNIAKVFGTDCQMFAKMLYLYMSKGYDRTKISFLRYLECLYPLFNNDNRQNHNKVAFKILDIDNDGQLNIMNLMHLHIYLAPSEKGTQSRLSNEIFKLIEYYIKNTLTKKQSSIQGTNPGINYDDFNKIVGKSCIIDQIRHSIFGVNPNDEMNILQVDPTQVFKKDYIFQDVNIQKDISFGQRGYYRNIDAILYYQTSVAYLNNVTGQ